MANEIEAYPLILLCGGQSSRMETPKGLLPYRRRAWLDEQIDRFESASGTHVVVVFGYHHERYLETLRWAPKALDIFYDDIGMQICVLVNPTPQHGPFSSLQRAIGFLKKLKFPGAFVTPIDVPCPRKEVWLALAGAMTGSIKAAIPRFQNRGGHPVLLSASFLKKLSLVAPTSPKARLDAQIRALPKSQIATVDVTDPHVCMNINSKSDFETYTRQIELGGKS